jgi:hypothetical protein
MLTTTLCKNTSIYKQPPTFLTHTQTTLHNLDKPTTSLGA